MHGPEAPFEEWLLAERERLRELALEALAKLLRHQRTAGAPEAAVQTALRLLALGPVAGAGASRPHAALWPDGPTGAAMSLARLLAAEGQPDETRRTLAEIYGWYTEGFDTADLQEAKAFLAELR